MNISPENRVFYGAVIDQCQEMAKQCQAWLDQGSATEEEAKERFKKIDDISREIFTVIGDLSEQVDKDQKAGSEDEDARARFKMLTQAKEEQQSFQKIASVFKKLEIRTIIFPDGERMDVPSRYLENTAFSNRAILSVVETDLEKPLDFRSDPLFSESSEVMKRYFEYRMTGSFQNLYTLTEKVFEQMLEFGDYMHDREFSLYRDYREGKLSPNVLIGDDTDCLIAFARKIGDETCALVLECFKEGIKEEDWLSFGAVDAVPLPDDLFQKLREASPIIEGHIVAQDFVLALIPRTVGGQPFTLNRLEDFVKELIDGGPGFRYIWDEITNRFGNNAPDRSYWVLMSKDVVPKSRGKTYFQQQTRVQNLGEAYEIPRFLEAAVCILTRYKKFGERLYSNAPKTYTRCQEMIDDLPLVVGGFAPSGLEVFSDPGSGPYGVGVLRKF